MASQDIVREQLKAIELTVAIAQHLSQTGNLVQIYTDRDLFDARLAAAR